MNVYLYVNALNLMSIFEIYIFLSNKDISHRDIQLL